MAIGYTEAYYPGMGIAEGSEFEYTPVSRDVQLAQARALQPGGSGEGGFNMQEAVKQLGLERAQKALVMAMRYQGTRMYQQALRNGEDPASALAKAAPLMFNDSAGVGAIAELTQPASNLEIVDLPGGRKAIKLRNSFQIIPESGPTAAQVMNNARLQSYDEFRRKQAEQSASMAAERLKLSQQNAERERLKDLTAASDAAAKSLLYAGANSPEYNAATNAIAGLKSLGGTVAIPPSIPTDAQETNAAPIAVTPATPAKIQSFPNEDDARKSGAKTGDIIYLKGIGKVRLK